MVDSEFVPNKQPDQCPAGSAVSASLRQLDLNGAAAQETIRTLVAKNVAITSTLPVFEAGGAPLAQTGIGAASALLNPRVLNVMSTDARVRYLQARARVSLESPITSRCCARSMDFERAFVQAGGLLIAGLDPTGNGGVVAGFGDLREVELLVEAGFTPVGSDQDCQLQRREVSRRRRAHRLDRAGQASRPDGRERKSRRQHQRHREGRDRFQRRRWLRLREIDSIGSGVGGDSVKSL